MKRVLRRLGHTNEDNVIQLKGQTASQISTADELVVTELMFNGVFGDLTPPQIVALLSALINTEKSSGGAGGGKGGAKGDGGDPAQRLPEELRHPFNQLKVAAKRVADIAQESQLDVDPEEFVGKFSPDLMEITHAWTKGVRAVLEGVLLCGRFHPSSASSSPPPPPPPAAHDSERFLRLIPCCRMKWETCNNPKCPHSRGTRHPPARQCNARIFANNNRPSSARSST